MQNSVTEVPAEPKNVQKFTAASKNLTLHNEVSGDKGMDNFQLATVTVPVTPINAS